MIEPLSSHEAYRELATRIVQEAVAAVKEYVEGKHPDRHTASNAVLSYRWLRGMPGRRGLQVADCCCPLGVDPDALRDKLERRWESSPRMGWLRFMGGLDVDNLPRKLGPRPYAKRRKRLKIIEKELEACPVT